MPSLRLLVPILLVFVLSACSGGDDAPASATPPPATDRPELRAKDLKFDQKALAVPPEREITVTFVNQDSGVLHNLAIYTDKSAKTKIFASSPFPGVKTETYRFTSPAPGTYFYRCDVHPYMQGTFFVVATN